MKLSLRCLCRVVAADLRAPLLPPAETPRRRAINPPAAFRRRSGVPEGHFPLYVGEEMERFVVRADLLARPAFAELLRRSALVYGYDQRGVLRIACPVDVFESVVLAICGGEDAAAAAEISRAVPDLDEVAAAC